MKPYFVRALPLVALSALAFTPLVRAQDTDLDFLSDTEELLHGTSPYNTDTDADGTLDRAEVYPFQVINGNYTFEQAVADAASRGGWLAIIDSPQKLYQVKRGLLTTALANPTPNIWDPSVTIPSGGLWIGAHDKVTSGLFQWVAPTSNSPTPLQGAEIGSAGFADLAPTSFSSTSTWVTGSPTPDNYLVKNVVDIKAFKVGRPFVASGVPFGTTITAINTASRTLTLSKPVDSVLSRRIGQIVVTSGGQEYTVQPTITFNDATRGLASVTIPSTNGVYASPPTMTFSGGGATTQASITATLDNTGRINGYVFTSRGVGYTSVPTAGTWSPAATSGTAPVPVADLGTYPTAEATLADGRITAINLTSDGTAWFNTAPTIVISNGNGSGATATTNLTAAAVGVISTVPVVAGGAGYTSPPTVAFVGGGGSGAVATATVSGGAVTRISIVNPGKDYVSPPIVTFTGGGGSGASASATIRQYSGRIESPILNAYSNWPLDLLPGNRAGTYEGVYLAAGTSFAWSTAQSTAEVASVTIATTAGTNSGYSSAPTVKFVGGGGSGATGTAAIDTVTGKVTSITITNPGTGFTSVPRVVMSGGLGLAPIGVVKSIDVNNMGNAVYNTPPTVNITGGGGTGASAVANLNDAGNLLSITMTSYGYGYTSAPVVTLDNGAVTPAVPVLPTLVANYGAATAASPFVIINKGNGYKTTPQVTISGGGGSGAEAIAAINGDGTLASITLTNPGTNYSSYPTVTISGGGGSGATAVIGIGSNAQATVTLTPTVTTTSRGYVLERPATNPLLADTDGDGLSDTDEFNVYGSSPILVDTDSDGINDSGSGWVNTAPTGTELPVFTLPSVYGDYEGLVMDPDTGISFKQTLRLTKTGTFSSKVLGLTVDAAYAGKFLPDGSFDATGILKNQAGLSDVHMTMVNVGTNKFYIQGSFTTVTDEVFYFELRPARPVATVARNLTFEASLTSGDFDGPTGSAVATGRIDKNGVVSFNVYMPDGSRSSYSGPTADGSYAMFHTRSNSKTVLVGSLLFRTIPGQSDFDGSVRLFNDGVANTFFPSGFDQRRQLLGSNFVLPLVGKLPLDSMKVSVNNALYQWSGGNFDGILKVGTWAINGSIVVPTTQTDSIKTSYANGSGLVSVSYTSSDYTKGLYKNTARGFAVVVQANQSIKGFYTSDRDNSAFSIVPNVGLLSPSITSITPLSYKTSAAPVTYTVSVNTTGYWTMEIPTDGTWISAKNPISSVIDPGYILSVDADGNATYKLDSDGDGITDEDESLFIPHTDPANPDTDGDGISDGQELNIYHTNPTVFDGNGNGRVVLTLAQNTTNQRRSMVITIAGQKHTITQAYR